ncbi:MAG: hypothetical protein U0T73_00945 [Chitinophagales bacterium]
MKKLIFFLAICAGQFASAQRADTAAISTEVSTHQFLSPKVLAAQATDQLNKVVKLTAQQRIKVEAINLDFQNQKAGVTAGQAAGLWDENIRTKVELYREERTKKVNAVLTTAQQKKLKEYREARRTAAKDSGTDPGKPILDTEMEW